MAPSSTSHPAPLSYTSPSQGLGFPYLLPASSLPSPPPPPLSLSLSSSTLALYHPSSSHILLAVFDLDLSRCLISTIKFFSLIIPWVILFWFLFNHNKIHKAYILWKGWDLSNILCYRILCIQYLQGQGFHLQNGLELIHSWYICSSQNTYWLGINVCCALKVLNYHINNNYFPLCCLLRLPYKENGIPCNREGLMSRL